MSRFLVLLLVTLSGTFIHSRAQGVTIHVLNPWADDPARGALPLYIRGADQMGYYPGDLMTQEGGDWWSYTFATPHTGLPYNPFPYVIVSGTVPNFQDAEFFAPAGITAAEPAQSAWFDQYLLGDSFPDATDIYIYHDGTRVVVTDIPPSSKVVFILNPWTVSAPTISVNGGEFEKMRLSDQCEWFAFYFTGDYTGYSISFQEIFGGALYGATGGGDATPIDLNAHFALNDSAFIYASPPPDGAPVVSADYPGFEGTCGFNLAATVRDFKSTHSDFENSITGGTLQPNMVGLTLGADKKPVLGPQPYYQANFGDWFNTKPGINAETCVDIPMTKTQGGLWEFDSYQEPSRGYFPIDDFNVFDTERNPSMFKDRGTGQYTADPTGSQHNFHFCLEMHANFVYRPAETGKEGQTFVFEGDDDVWVYIDNQLMIDLGGIHEAEAATLVMDNIAPAMGWNAGDTLDFDFFFCERQTTSSNLWIRTSIYFEQELTSWIDTVQNADGSVRYDIWRLVGADGSCGSVTGSEQTLPEPAVYTLTGPGITGILTLDNSNTPRGITIIPALTSVTVDTTEIRTSGSLSPGTYMLTITTSNNPVREFRIPFTVNGEAGVQFLLPKTPVDTLAGEAIPIQVTAVVGGNPSASARDFKLQIPAGLEVYTDAAKTSPVSAASVLSTDAGTGLSTLWVTGTTQATSTQTYTLVLLNGTGLQADTYPDLTFRVPEIGFITKPPVDTLVGIAVQVSLGTLFNDSVVPISRNFTLTIPPGVAVYQDAALTVPVTSGETLTTNAQGTFEVWVLGEITIPEDSLYTLGLNADGGAEVDSYSMTFRIPRLRFVDVNGTPLDPLPDLDQTEIQMYLVRVEVYTDVWGTCSESSCADPLGLTSTSPNLRFKEDPAGPDITNVTLVNGIAEFYIYAGGPVPSVDFTVQGTSSGTMARWISALTISYDVTRAWIIDGNGDGQADSVFVHLTEGVYLLPDVINSISWPAEGDQDKQGTAANISQLNDSVLVIDFSSDPFEFGMTSPDGTPALTMPDDATAVIEDGVGPVILAAEMVPPEYKRYILEDDPRGIIHIMPDTLVLSLSETIMPLPTASGDTWVDLIMIVKGCGDGEPVPMPLTGPPSINPATATVRLPVLKSNQAEFVELGDCVFLNADGQYGDAAANRPSEVMAEVTGEEGLLSNFHTSLLQSIIGSSETSSEIHLQSGGVIAVVDSDGNIVSTSEAGEVQEWIPPLFMTEDGVINETAQESCDPSMVQNVTPRLFPPNCLSSIGIFSDVAYSADVVITDHLGKYIASSRQNFGLCGELENPDRLHPGGYLSFLIWNQKNTEGNLVGSGVYIWHVTYKFHDDVSRTEMFKQGIVRGEDPLENCAAQ